MNAMRASLYLVMSTLLACAGASAGETKPAKAVGVAVPPEGANAVSAVSSLGGKGSGAASASYARQASGGEPECSPDPAPAPAPEAAKNTGPGRISTNVTVPKQTQVATFGEKVNQGVQATGGSLSQGAATVGAAVPGGAVVSARCAKPPEPEPMTTPESNEK